MTTNFEVDFYNVPQINNTTLTYTLILSQGSTAYMLNAVKVNGTSVTIKWANGNIPSGNANQVDMIGLLAVINNTGNVAHVLGQAGTFA
jgi:hypothetical protein